MDAPLPGKISAVPFVLLNIDITQNGSFRFRCDWNRREVDQWDDRVESKVDLHDDPVTEFKLTGRKGSLQEDRRGVVILTLDVNKINRR